MARVLIAAGEAAERAKLSELVSGSSDHVVVGSARNDASAIAAAVERHRPDVLVLVTASDSDSFSLGLWADGALPTVVLFENDVSWSFSEAVHSGVRGILPRSSSGEEIAAAIQAVHVGLVAFHADAVAALAEPAPQLHARPTIQRLTAREVEVLHMLAEGLGNKEIAPRLGISDHTVKFHISSIFTKLGVSTRTEAVTAGIRGGLIMI